MCTWGHNRSSYKRHWIGTKQTLCTIELKSSSSVWIVYGHNGRVNFEQGLGLNLIHCPHSSSAFWLPTTDLVESVDCLLRDCERYFSNADRNMAENLIVRLQVTINSVRGLLDSLDLGEARNTARILVLEGLVIQLRTLFSIFALSRNCQRFLWKSRSRADLDMKYLYLSWSFSGIQSNLPGLK